MHVKPFLHKLLGSVTHNSTRNSLIDKVIALTSSKKMTLTGLGRALKRKNIQERSAIKAVDRFLRNVFFQETNSIIYKALSLLMIGNQIRPEIIVDWSKIPNQEAYVLRAALAATGRAITLYEEVHQAKKVGNVFTQKRFLKNFNKLVPSDSKPIIITDAGFKSSWFKEVLKLEWSFVGRVRQLNQIEYSEDGKIFKKCIELAKKGNATAKCLGKLLFGKTNPYSMWCYVVKKKIKGRKKRLKNGKVDNHTNSKQYSRGEREGWVIVSSIAPSCSLIAKRIIAIYSRRMTIEEGFRDLKSSRYGFGMEQNKTIDQKRLIVWLMLAAVASLLAWVVGYSAEKNKIHYQFQANSIKHRRVLSFFYLGCRVIIKKIKIPIIPLEEINFFER